MGYSGAAFVGWGRIALGSGKPVYSLPAGPSGPVSGMGLATYVSDTTKLAAGTYLAAWDVVCTCTASGATPGGLLTLGGSEVPSAGVLTSGSSPANGRRVALGSVGTFVHAGGDLSVLLQINRSGGTGNVIPQAGQITIWSAP